MFFLRVIAAGALAASLALAGTPAGDARRGEELFSSQGCIQCHSLNGKGGRAAPDLAKRIDRNYTPTVMASLMWNHGPDMWAAMKAQGITTPHLTPEQAADLFAYFVSARYFEQPGDAGRGKAVFAAKHCGDCHGLTESKAEGAPPVAKWDSLADPILLADQMWNHGSRMKEAFSARGLTRPTFTRQELTDMLLYLRNLPEARGVPSQFEFAGGNDGAKLFQSKGCAECHATRVPLEDRLRNMTLTEIAAEMWNHQPLMKQPPIQLTPDEMRQIIGYLWARQYFRGTGSPERGKAVFAAKQCATCHNDPASGAPKLAKGKNAYSDITMVSTLWGHGPQMYGLMTQKKIPWPRFTAVQMSDLIAYLNSL
jgi:mono/diheme cytochrome c family protein